MTTKMGMWREKLTGTATDTTHTVDSEAVPEDERRFLVRTCATIDTTDNADVLVYIVSHGEAILLCGMVNITVALAKGQRHMLWLTDGEFLRFVFSGIVSGEVVEVGITGHKQYEQVK